MDDEIKMMLNPIIDEMERMEERANKRFDKIEGELDTLHHEVNVCKPEGNSIGFLIKKSD